MVKVVSMPKYIIERNIPGASDLSPEELRTIAGKSNDVLSTMGHDIQWLESYVAGDSFYCVYIAPNEGKIREHARLGGFPANKITEVSTIIDPTTAEI